MTTRQVLLLIFAFLTLTVGSFVWFVVTWSADEEPALSFLMEEQLAPASPDFSRKIWFPAPLGATL